MILFGKWSLWATILITTVLVALSIAINGNIVIAAALIMGVVAAAIYNLRGNTSI